MNGFDNFGSGVSGGGYGSYGGGGFHNIPSAWDAINQRRANVSQSAPSGYSDPATSGTASQGWNPDWMHAQAMNDTYARTLGARMQAMNSSPNDPSLAAYGGLNAAISGQGDAARAALDANTRMRQIMQQQAFQSDLAARQHQWEMDAIRAQHANDWMNMVGQIGGAGLGAVTPGGWAKFGRGVSGMFGHGNGGGDGDIQSLLGGIDAASTDLSHLYGGG